MKKKLLQWWQCHDADFTLFPSKRSMGNCRVLLVAEMPLSSFTVVMKEVG